MNLAYVAGLIDADGSIGLTVSRSSVFVPRVTVTNTNLRLLEDLRAAFGGNIQPLSRREVGWKDGYYWQITNSSAVRFVAKIERWLRAKWEQALVLEAWQALRECREGPIDDEYREAMHLLNRQSKWLNWRGTGRPAQSPVDAELEAIAYSVKRKAKK